MLFNMPWEVYVISFLGGLLIGAISAGCIEDDITSVLTMVKVSK
jgi:hypothetical protein